MEPNRVEVIAADGIALAAHWWQAARTQPSATVIINAATGVRARYYHRYAAFLAANGFRVITYDYRGIGLSRPSSLKGSTFTWRDWGFLDFDAVLKRALQEDETGRLLVVGHSIGGFLAGYSAAAGRISAMLSVGGQYGYWGDYRPTRRLPLFLKWHVAMPAIAMMLGHFPGKRLGWLEDLPKGVAYGWGLQQGRAEQGLSRAGAEAMQDRFAAAACPILSVTMSDDEIATPKAVSRAMRYYRRAPVTKVLLRPDDLGFDRVGHFDLFHARHESVFWRESLDFLHSGHNPWGDRVYL
ncbi:alpha/beta hydrolase family protein [Peteryoungia ipomoeae]|uniref:Alpha/beta fold hydrolase n=1 Tax=Peteryoungia ipomoeae TaxID=1210932 RepID=A0A4V4HN01_9HYPH|nr:alpha/beta fold hydrolase [Peteryoungia ipomoeae]THV24116.1 alpha/beta fold hydrolase [Peteryoungia ipomoeae]